MTIQEFEEVFAELKGMLHLPDEVMIRLNNKFFESVSLTLIQLNEAVAAVNYEAIEMLAHTIKGSSGSLCYTAISDLAQILEKNAHLRTDYTYQATVDDLIKRFHAAQESYGLWKEKQGF